MHLPARDCRYRKLHGKGHQHDLYISRRRMLSSAVRTDRSLNYPRCELSSRNQCCPISMTFRGPGVLDSLGDTADVHFSDAPRINKRRVDNGKRIRLPSVSSGHDHVSLISPKSMQHREPPPPRQPPSHSSRAEILRASRKDTRHVV